MVSDRLRRLKSGAIDESKKLFGIFIYLWVLFSLFSLHKALVLKEAYLIYDQGFAVVNALVLAKVVLIGEYFNLGENLKDRPLIYPILFKSALFASLLICFHIGEQAFRGVLGGMTLSKSVSGIGGGRLQGILMVGIIMFVVLMPFFAFRELDRAIGAEKLHSLLFGDKSGNGAALPVTSRGWRTATAAALAVALAGGWLVWSLHRDATMDYAALHPDRDPAVRAETTSVIGTASAAPVGARVSGVIEAVDCDVNMKVKAGQRCAKIDPRPYLLAAGRAKSDLALAVAQLEKDKVALTEAKAALEQREALAKRRKISRKAFDKSRKAYEQLQAQMTINEARVGELQAALHAAEVNLDDTDIVAPVAGTIISRSAALGQTVAADSKAPPLFVIATDPAVPR
jgi:biotin carboxyl carrier protein